MSDETFPYKNNNIGKDVMNHIKGNYCCIINHIFEDTTHLTQTVSVD